MLALITEQEALPWHRFDTQVFPYSGPGQAVANEAKLPSVSGSAVRVCICMCICVCACVCVCLASFKKAHMSVYAAPSQFKITDMCQSLCLARFACTAVARSAVQDEPQ